MPSYRIRVQERTYKRGKVFANCAWISTEKYFTCDTYSQILKKWLKKQYYIFIPPARSSAVIFISGSHGCDKFEEICKSLWAAYFDKKPNEIGKRFRSFDGLSYLSTIRSRRRLRRTYYSRANRQTRLRGLSSGDIRSARCAVPTKYSHCPRTHNGPENFRSHLNTIFIMLLRISIHWWIIFSRYKSKATWTWIPYTADKVSYIMNKFEKYRRGENPIFKYMKKGGHRSQPAKIVQRAYIFNQAWMLKIPQTVLILFQVRRRMYAHVHKRI